VDIANFEVVDFNQFMSLIFNIEEDEDVEEDNLLSKIGIDSSNIVLNISSYIFIFMIITLLIIGLIIIRVFRNTYPL